MNGKMKKILWVVVALVVLAGMAAVIPPVRDRIAWRLDELQVRIRYAIHPPEEAVFVPQAKGTGGTPEATSTPAPTFTLTPTRTQAAVTETPQPTLTATLSPTPVPSQVALKGVKYEDQHGLYNYCAPANLSMALSYWGWKGNRTDTGAYLKPYAEDLNVMPYEMQAFVEEKTELAAVYREGGTIDLLKSLIAAGFPVVVEKGPYIRDLSGKVSWMGHYQVLTGYNDVTQKFIAQDSYYSADYPDAYDQMIKEWRSFNYAFLVVYAKDQQDKLFSVLGPYSDTVKASQIAAQKASEEIYLDDPTDQFFAWYNRGTSLMHLQDYGGAAEAYDQAFSLYASLPKDNRPWRIVWYETGPYFAYYYTGRYADVINLATTTLDAANKPYLEESYYWRALARIAVGDQGGAVDDLKTSLQYHPGFEPSLTELQRLGVSY
jgi:tetratricopeptide (TPR) repeat protein